MSFSGAGFSGQWEKMSRLTIEPREDWVNVSQSNLHDRVCLIVRDAKAQIILTSDLASYFLLRRNSRSKYRYSTPSPALILL